MGVEFCRLDFGVWLAAHSISSQCVGDSDGQTQGSAPTFRNAAASRLSRCTLISAARPRGPQGPPPATRDACPVCRRGRRRSQDTYPPRAGVNRHTAASRLPRYIQVTLPRRDCPGTLRSRKRVRAAHPLKKLQDLVDLTKQAAKKMPRIPNTP